MSVEDPSISELRDMINGGNTALADPAAPEPEVEVEAPAAVEEVPAAEPDPAQEPEIVQERDEHGKFVAKDPAPVEEKEIPPGGQKAIDKEIGKAVRARRETERLNARLEAQLRKLEEATPPAAQNTPPKAEPATASTPKPVYVAPKIEDFEYDNEAYAAAQAVATAEYADKLTDWKLEQRDLKAQATAQAETRQAADRTLNERIDALTQKGNEEFDDFGELLGRDPKDGGPTITPNMRDVILDQPEAVAVKLAYHLANNVAESKRIGNLSPVAQVRALDNIVATFTPAPKAAATVAKATPGSRALPKPPVVLGTGGASAAVDLDSCDMRAFAKEFDRLAPPRR